MTIDDTIIASAFSTAFVALGGTILVLWKKLAADHAAVVARVEALEEENRELREAMAPGQAAVAKIDSCPSQSCPWRARLSDHQPLRALPA